jgi:hypothetical protein
MPVRAVKRPLPALTRRSGVLAGVIGIASAFSIGIASDPQVAKAVGDGVNRGAKSVAALFTQRSPGARPKGRLAKLKQLKHRRLAHRVLPLRHHVIPPIAAVVAAPETPFAIPNPVPPPLYTVMAGPPPVPVPPVPIAPGGGGGGGPPIFSPIPLPGGGGGFVPPPIITTAVPPPTVTVTALPEPASWAMMLAGFAMMGAGLRRERRRGPSQSTR